MQARGKPRVPVDYAVQFTGDQGSGHGVLRNLTIAGGEIESRVHVPQGTHLCLQVQPSGARPPLVVALAVVRWQRGDHFGVEFVRFDGQAKQQLEDMLNQRDGTPAD